MDLKMLISTEELWRDQELSIFKNDICIRMTSITVTTFWVAEVPKTLFTFAWVLDTA
jgi:hypothetical protein